MNPIAAYHVNVVEVRVRDESVSKSAKHGRRRSVAIGRDGRRWRLLTRFRDWYFEGGSAAVDTMPVLSTRLYRHAQPMAREVEPAAWRATASAAMAGAAAVPVAAPVWPVSMGPVAQPARRTALLGHAIVTRPALIGCRP